MGHCDDLKCENFRRLLVNACYWCMGLEEKIPAKAKVDLVGSYDPNPIHLGGFKKNVKPSDYQLRKQLTWSPIMQSNRSTRRKFLQQTGGALAGATLAGAISQRAYAGEDNTIKIALVGCGGRGNGAVREALQTAGPTKLVAAADFFEDSVKGCIKGLSRGPLAKQVDVPPDRQFVGLDAYKKAIDAIGPGGVVLLATPPAFRPIHLEYAVAKGCHVFMEKSFAVDAPGIRRVLKAGEEATKKNLKIAGGLRCRHDEPLEEAIGLMQKGLIGDLITLWAYRVHGPVGFHPRTSDVSELAHQIRNYSCYTWLNGSFLLDWLIHNLDICCWIKGAWPVSAQGQGGRQTRTEADQLFDHYAVEYTFADGTRHDGPGPGDERLLGVLRRRGPRQQGVGGAGRRAADAADLQGLSADGSQPDLEARQRRVQEPVPGRARPVVRCHSQRQAL